MIRVTTSSAQGSARTFEDADFIAHIRELSQVAFASAPAGPVVVEAVSERGEVLWTGHYRAYHRLLRVADDLVFEGLGPG